MRRKGEAALVTFLHAADLHLDSPFSGLKGLPEYIWRSIRQSTFHALHALVDAAIQKEVDFVLLAGDIYDLEDRSIKAQAVFREEMERLNQADVPVFMIHGNHDFIAEEELHLEMPDNVIIFGPDIDTVRLKTKRGERIALSGFSYDQRWVSERKIQDYPHRQSTVDWHIGLLHGFSEGNHSEHAHYAPFSLPELQSKEYDYWALGHIHKYQKVSDHPLAYYPGCLQGRNKKETGSKGFLSVTLTSTEQSVEFEPVAPIEWISKEIELEKDQSLDQIYTFVKEEVNKQTHKEKNIFLSLTLLGGDDLPASVKKKIQNGELLEAFQPSMENFPFVWLNELSIKQETEDKIPALEALFPEEWAQAMEEIQQDGIFREVTEDFFQQAKQATLLENRNEVYRKAVVEQALEHLYAIMGVEEEDED